MWRSPSLLQDKVIPFRPWTLRILVINLQGGFPPTAGVTMNTGHPRPERERPMANLNCLSSIDRQTVSRFSFHLLNALCFVGLLFPFADALSDIAQTMLTGRLMVYLDRVYPTSHITGQEG